MLEGNLLSSLDKLIGDLESFLYNEPTIIARDAIDDISERIVDDRVDHNGSPWGQYAQDTFTEAGKEVNYKGENYNFHRDNKLINSLEPFTTRNGLGFVIEIYPTHPEREGVIEMLESKYGDILQLSEKELEIIFGDHMTRAEQILSNNGF